MKYGGSENSSLLEYKYNVTGCLSPRASKYVISMFLPPTLSSSTEESRLILIP